MLYYATIIAASDVLAEWASDSYCHQQDDTDDQVERLLSLPPIDDIHKMSFALSSNTALGEGQCRFVSSPYVAYYVRLQTTRNF